MARIRRVLIVGGGIGGLALSIALRKAAIDVEIVEIKQKWTVYHVGIIAQSNLVRALVSLGVADECVAAGFPYAGVKFCDSSGNVLNEFPSIRLAGPNYPAFLGLTRPALHTILSEASRKAGTAIHLGVTVTQLLQYEDKIAARFSDGNAADYDLVVGADGVHSKIRGMVFGEHLAPKFTGEGVWRYNVPRPPHVDYGSIYATREGPKAGLIPLTREMAYIFHIGPEPGNPRHPQDQLADIMHERLNPFGGTIGKLASRHIVDPTLVVYRPLHTVLVPSPWYRGRVVLIGDAAHTITPHLGQGAAQAVEDAVVLADVVQRDEPIAKSLDAFMHRRFDRCRVILEASLQIGEWELHPDPTADVPALSAKVGQMVAQPI
jgi:2-polyprenyl-6-methoxyphenol hydroxylase-like FAD-dependent oxidoreductase